MEKGSSIIVSQQKKKYGLSQIAKSMTQVKLSGYDESLFDS